MSDLRLPCREGDPDDWFISKDGKQYPSDELVTSDEALAHLEEEHPGWRNSSVEEIEKIVDRLEADAKTASLRRRRHAKEDCQGCLFRTRCLQMALEGDFQHGTWGGYYEEEIREIRRELARRRRGRKA